MAIVNGDNFSDYDKVQEIIIDVLTNRKLLFRKDVEEASKQQIFHRYGNF